MEMMLLAVFAFFEINFLEFEIGFFIVKLYHDLASDQTNKIPSSESTIFSHKKEVGCTIFLEDRV